MKKSNLISVLSAFLVSVMFLASCSKSVEYVNVIPADASVIASLDLKSLTQKSGVNDNEAAKQQLAEVLKSGLNADALQYMDKVLKDPAESGISTADKVYLFAMEAAENQGLVAKVNDMNKVKELFKLLESEQISMPLEDTGVNGYQLTFLNEKDVVCFNENTLLILIGKNVFDTESTKDMAKELIAQTAEQSIASNNGFKQMSAKNADVVVYTTMDVLPSDYAMQIKAAMPEGLTLKDIAYVVTLNFEKGKIVLDAESVKNETVDKLNKQYEGLISKIGSEFLKYFPASSLYYTGMNLNGEKLAKVLAENEEFQKTLKGIEGNGVNVNNIINSINGDLAYGITSLSAQGVPALTCYVQVKNDEILKTVNNALQGGATKIDDNNYSVTIGGGVNAYYGMKDGVFYFTLDEVAAKNICKKVDNPMSGAKWASTAKGSYVFMVANIKDALNQPMVNLMLSMGGQQAALARSVLSQFDYIELYAPEMNKVTLDVVMTNQDENALKQLFALGEKLAGGK